MNMQFQVLVVVNILVSLPLVYYVQKRFPQHYLVGALLCFFSPVIGQLYKRNYSSIVVALLFGIFARSIYNASLVNQMLSFTDRWLIVAVSSLMVITARLLFANLNQVEEVLVSSKEEKICDEAV